MGTPTSPEVPSPKSLTLSSAAEHSIGNLRYPALSFKAEEVVRIFRLKFIWAIGIMEVGNIAEDAHDEVRRMFETVDFPTMESDMPKVIKAIDELHGKAVSRFWSLSRNGEAEE
tara:strand:- start:3523 stop:3864 length:342 start_codon:yes stop_codon:yes gene_type:complete